MYIYVRNILYTYKNCNFYVWYYSVHILLGIIRRCYMFTTNVSMIDDIEYVFVFYSVLIALARSTGHGVRISKIMRSNQPQAHDRSALSLTRNFNASNVESYTKSAIRDISARAKSAYSQRFGNKWNRTRSRSNRWHITTERAGNITGAWLRARAAARATCVCGRSGDEHDVLATRVSRREWEAAPDAAASAGRPGRAPPLPHPTRLSHPAHPPPPTTISPPSTYPMSDAVDDAYWSNLTHTLVDDTTCSNIRHFYLKRMKLIQIYYVAVESLSQGHFLLYQFHIQWYQLVNNRALHYTIERF